MLRELTKADIIPLLTKSEKRNHFINQKIQESKGELKSPYPSPIDYWNTIVDGFAKYPSRLDKFIEAKKIKTAGYSKTTNLSLLI